MGTLDSLGYGAYGQHSATRPTSSSRPRVINVRIVDDEEAGALPAKGALTDRSGTITSGGTAQTAASALATRKYLLFQNVSDTDMWINFGVTAVADQPSIKIASGASYESSVAFCPTGLVSVICATTGKAFTCKEA